MKTVCRCRHCNQDIEFESEASGAYAVCPHCNLETLLFVPAVPVTELAVEPAPPKIDTNIYSSGIVTVSSKFFIVGGNTYPIAAITSLKVLRVPANRSSLHLLYTFTVVFLIFGIALLTQPESRIAAFVLFIASVGCLIAALFVWREMKDSYALGITTAAQEQQVLHSSSIDEILWVQAALQKAIALRG